MALGWVRPIGWPSGTFIKRRHDVPDCLVASTISDHITVAPPISEMNAARFIRAPGAIDEVQRIAWKLCCAPQQSSRLKRRDGSQATDLRWSRKVRLSPDSDHP